MSCFAESVQSFAMTCFSSTSTHPLFLYKISMLVIPHMVLRYKGDEEVYSTEGTPIPTDPATLVQRADSASLGHEAAVFKVINIDMPCLLPWTCFRTSIVESEGCC